MWGHKTAALHFCSESNIYRMKHYSLILVLGFVFTIGYSQNTQLVYDSKNGNYDKIRVFHVEEDAVFKLFVDNDLKEYTTPVYSEFLYSNHTLEIIPRFPFTPGLNYVVIGDHFEKLISIPTNFNKTTEVVSIHPQLSVIPSNVLRFYIYFSAPMREGDFLNYVVLKDKSGRIFNNVFFDNQYELWNSDRTRLTILVDPGRVKTGLQANLNLGIAFEEGNTYTLTIKKEWKDIYGNTLGSDFSKTYSIGARDTIYPNHSDWVVHQPTVNSKETLVIDFKDTLDHVSSANYISIMNANGDEVSGEVFLNDGSKFQFIPSENWQDSEYIILINSRIEDLAGNNLNGLFDHEPGSLKSLSEGELLTIRFSCID